jgi:hypothetical protein
MASTLTLFAGAPQGTSTLAGWLPAMNRRNWVFGGVLAASAAALALSLGLGGDDATLAPVAVPLAQVAADLAQRPLFVANGVVETIKEMRGAGGGARQFEMTIRMRDGTMRVSHETGNASWRAGDAIRLIGSPPVL